MTERWLREREKAIAAHSAWMAAGCPTEGGLVDIDNDLARRRRTAIHEAVLAFTGALPIGRYTYSEAVGVVTADIEEWAERRPASSTTTGE